MIDVANNVGGLDRTIRIVVGLVVVAFVLLGTAGATLESFDRTASQPESVTGFSASSVAAAT